MPHMFQKSEIRNQKSEGNRNFRNKKQELNHQVSGEFQRSEITNQSGQTYCRVDIRFYEYLRITMQIKSAKDLTVYKRAYELAMQIFHTSKHFPAEERYSLTDQLRRSSRSVCSNLREAWAKRRYEAHFVSKLQIQTARMVKLKPGSISHMTASICRNTIMHSSPRNVVKSEQCLEK